MYYLDTQRTATRRDSSLITTGRRTEYETPATTVRGGGASTTRLPTATESVYSLQPKQYGSVRKEIITVMFESMLDHIVDRWDVVKTSVPEDSCSLMTKTLSDVAMGKKRKSVGTRSAKAKVKSRLSLGELDPMQISWWSQPDEKAVITFKNGNVYEGDISMKTMNGEGRFQWADGTVYLGQFKDNEIVGKGTITWKDDCWYAGEFLGNLRHGTGLYVDSRRQRHYTGQWHCATKHGRGQITYKRGSSYKGDWFFNVRHGFGTREYCPKSVYEGEWDFDVREGQGTMIWPNHDYYKGEWRNGVMSGYGLYIWGLCYNNSMSLPSTCAYRGCWSRGKRTGFGLLDLGFGLGSHYKGEFKENKKHGMGKVVTNNGLIVKHKQLFIEDGIKPKVQEESCDKLELCSIKRVIHDHKDPMELNFCDNNQGLQFHIEEAIKNLDKQPEVMALIINDYIEYNQTYDLDLEDAICDDVKKVSEQIPEDMVEFEKDALNKAIRCYQKELNNIYFHYATICNTDPIHFNPILIRLYLWQFYYDCDMHEKGLLLAEIDEMFARNRNWLSKTPHGPFESVYFWQFINSLISVACRLYAKRNLPGPRPDTVVAIAFREFMDNDALPNLGRCKGYLPQSFGSYVSLQALYKLYQELGEPHTVRQFLCAVNQSPHLTVDLPEPDLVETPDELLPLGRNAYVVGDELTFLSEDSGNFSRPKHRNLPDYEIRKAMRLYNFGNLSSKTVLKIAATIFPGVYENQTTLMDVDSKMTFFEFFQMCIACSEESIRVKEEEMRWRELFDSGHSTARSIHHPTPYVAPHAAASRHVAITPKAK
ncbi:hypothetical protein NE865_13312 [Phthorimaea operculella]|nr:hypothetical protein NE865_13312 [Phthorimaea operculella]